uniref:Fe2OG dioxygenase domain-containing protein n=1 Tax=Arcella intermedia TaxID=1963864 RepID=A0A6B2LCF6_9EUKA
MLAVGLALLGFVPSSSQDLAYYFELPCHPPDYIPKYPGCTPEVCKRVTVNNFTTMEKVERLRDMAARAMAFGGGGGGPTIFEISSGTLSKEDKFIDLYKLLTRANQPIFLRSDFELLQSLIEEIKALIGKTFSVSAPSLYLTHPVFFTNISSKPALTDHDQYWHSHIDKQAYGTFVYTCLIYLSDYNQDFKGGLFVFEGKDGRSLEPHRGRLSCFTSASENPHYVQKVVQGCRWAITIPFTCNPDQAAQWPSLDSPFIQQPNN